mgnify:FL=1
MTQTIRVSLPGFNAGTDTNIDHYSLYADSDNVLIKEKTRGTISVANGAIGTVAHGQSYIPFTLAFGSFGGTRAYLSGNDLSSSYPVFMRLDGTNVYFINNNSGTVSFQYYIFYDQQV